MPIKDYDKIAHLARNAILRNTKISDKNKNDLELYLRSLNVSGARVGIICKHLQILFLEIDDVIGEKNNRILVNETFQKLKATLSRSYVETVRNVGKAFVRWHNDGETPKGWKDIKSGGKNAQKRDLRPQDMISWEDGLKIIENTSSIQLRAAILCQLDGGFRPSEFIDLKYSDVTKDGRYLIARVSGKTGNRSVHLIRCNPWLQKWLDVHAFKGNSHLWIMERFGDRPYTYDAIKKQFLELGRKSGLNKPFDFYNFRHSKATQLKLDNIPVEIAAAQMGHTVKYFTETYGRLSLKDVSRRLDRAYGKIESESEKENMPITCSICGCVNNPTNSYCEKCQNPLSIKTAISDAQRLKATEERLQNLVEKYEMLADAFQQRYDEEPGKPQKVKWGFDAKQM